jgi:serine/threonine protein kinase
MLLGAGSYGKVYAAKWHGQEVAVKVIHCLPDELQRVLREAEIMLQLHHPNVSFKHTLATLLCLRSSWQLPGSLQSLSGPARQHGGAASLRVLTGV